MAMLMKIAGEQCLKLHPLIQPRGPGPR